MTNYKKQFILKSFEEMNIDSLELSLDDNNTYQDATKEVFLEKLKNTFENFKKDGDSFLKAHKGYCVSNICENVGCEGFSFVGNVSKNYTSFIFEEREDDYKDIYQCNDFLINNDSIELEEEITIDLKEIHKAAYPYKLEYVMLNQKCDRAVGFLKNNYAQPIIKDDYRNWMANFKSLKEEIPNELLNDGFRHDFLNLYNEFVCLDDFLSREDQANTAINEYYNLDSGNELEILKWLVNYERLGFGIIAMVSRYLSDKEMNDDFVYIIDKSVNITIPYSIFEKLMEMYEFYNSIYFEKLSYYEAIVEQAQFGPFDDIYTLSGYLKYLKII